MLSIGSAVVQFFIFIALFAQLEPAHAARKKPAYVDRHCEVQLSLPALNLAEGPLQKDLHELLKSFSKVDLRLSWNDVTGTSTELAKAGNDTILPLVAAHPTDGTGIQALIHAYEIGIEPSVYNTTLIFFRLVPVKLNDQRTVFDLSVDLDRLNFGRTPDKLNALSILTVLSAAPYVHHLRIDMTVTRTDGPEDLPREANPELYAKIRELIAAKTPLLKIATDLNLAGSEFMKAYLPNLPLVHVSISEPRPKVDEHDDLYRVSLYYKVPNYVQWLADQGSPHAKTILEIMEDRKKKAN